MAIYRARLSQDDRPSFLFVHVPKTGGGTINRILEHHGGDQLAVHLKAAEALDAIGDVAFEAAISFGVRRNPFARALSGFRWQQRAGVVGTRGEQTAKESSSFPEYCEAMHDSGGVIEPAALFLGIGTPAEVDNVLRYESIGDDWQRIAAELGIDPDELNRGRYQRHRNRGSSRKYREHFDRRSREIIEREAAADFEIWRYEF